MNVYRRHLRRGCSLRHGGPVSVAGASFKLAARASADGLAVLAIMAALEDPQRASIFANISYARTFPCGVVQHAGA